VSGPAEPEAPPGQTPVQTPPEQTPVVSVITPVWNAAATLSEAVASVQAQTEPAWEMILIDDGSTDGSRALAERLAAEEPRLRVIGFPVNRGAAAARNAGIRAARGRFIAFLDADDRWYPEKLKLQLVFMVREGVPFVFASYRRIDPAGRPLGIVRAPARVSFQDALGGNAIGCLTAVYDARFFGQVAMPDLRRRQDYGLWLELLRRTPHAAGLPEVLADYRVQPGSLSANKLKAARATWTVLREVAGLPRARASWYFLRYAQGALRKRLG